MLVYPFGFNTVITYPTILPLFRNLLFAGSLGANVALAFPFSGLPTVRASSFEFKWEPIWRIHHYLVVSRQTITYYKAILINLLSYYQHTSNTFPWSASNCEIYRQTKFTWTSRRRSQALNNNISPITGIIVSGPVSHTLGANMASFIILIFNLRVVIVSYARANTATTYSCQSYVQCVQ